MDIKIHDTFFENMCCKKSAKEYEKFILRCGISVKSENAIQIMPDRTADITFKISLSVMQTPFKYISDHDHPDICCKFVNTLSNVNNPILRAMMPASIALRR